MTTETTSLTTEHSPVAGLAHDQRGGISNPILGMILFIASEVMFFAGLFAAYFTIRGRTTPWPPINPDTGHEFHLSILPLVGPATWRPVDPTGLSRITVAPISNSRSTDSGSSPQRSNSRSWRARASGKPW